jgi:hypothetical protein
MVHITQVALALGGYITKFTTTLYNNRHKIEMIQFADGMLKDSVTE